jgi:hypothetical protein
MYDGLNLSSNSLTLRFNNSGSKLFANWAAFCCGSACVIQSSGYMAETLNLMRLLRLCG